jgi:hypothetical protein
MVVALNASSQLGAIVKGETVLRRTLSTWTGMNDVHFVNAALDARNDPKQLKHHSKEQQHSV